MLNLLAKVVHRRLVRARREGLRCRAEKSDEIPPALSQGQGSQTKYSRSGQSRPLMSALGQKRKYSI
jgi:hypothetical protein